MTQKEDKLIEYLSETHTISDLLELWSNLAHGLYSPDEVGVIYHMIEEHGSEAILKELSGLILKGLTSDGKYERADALEKAEAMGYFLS